MLVRCFVVKRTERKTLHACVGSLVHACMVVGPVAWLCLRHFRPCSGIG